MNSVEKLTSMEHGIRRKLGRVALLEPAYALARAEEIALGISSRKPFLKSRGIDRQIRLEINAALRIQTKYNKYVKAEQRIYLVESLIQSEAVFVRSKILLQQIQKRSTEIKNGLAAKEAYLFGGYSPSASNTDETLAERIIREHREKQQKATDEVAQSYMDFLNSTPPGTVETNNTEEETEENGQTDNN